MKTTKRVFSFLLALLMMLSLLPTPALAEAVPAFTLQPESGSHAPGESYVLTWELNQTPDRLELVKEAPEGADALGGPFEDEQPALLSVQELDPESSELALTAPEEETVFHLRAFYGEEELLSEPFTVTEEAAEDDTSSGAGAPPSPQGEGTEAEEPVGADAPGGPQDETAEPVDEGTSPPSPTQAPEADPPAGEDNVPEEPESDEPEDAPEEPEGEGTRDGGGLVFTVQPQSGSYDPDTLVYNATWTTTFTPKKVKIYTHEFSYGWYDNYYDSITTGLNKDGSYPFPATKDTKTFFIRAFYGTGEDDYVDSDYFTVWSSDLVFTAQPQSGGYNPDTLTYNATWTTNFTPVRVKIYTHEFSYGWYDNYYDSITTGLNKNGNYPFPATKDTKTFFIRAFYGTGEDDYVDSDTFTVWSSDLAFTAQPVDGSYDPDTLTYEATWTTNFKPVRVKIYTHEFSYGWYDNYYDSITTGLNKNGSYPFPATKDYKTFFIRAFYGTGENDYVDSDYFSVSITPLPSSGSCGDSLTWSYAGGTLTISGTGAMEDYAAGKVPWKNYRYQIQTVVVEEGVTAIGQHAFHEHLGLKTVYLPSTIEEIRDYALDSSPDLADVYINIPEADYPSLSWDSETNSSMAAATIHFTYRARGTCGPNLNWKLVDSTLIIEGSGTMYSFSESYRPGWFAYRDEITEIQISGAASIGSYAFAYTSAEKVTIPSTVTVMGNYAFSGCTKLKTVSIKSTYLDIPDYCFYNCTSLKLFTLPLGATRIGTAAFYGCSSLTNIYIYSQSELSTIGSSAFENCTSLSSVVLQKKLTSIGSKAFKNCMALVTVNASACSQLTTVGDSAFEDCKKLNKLLLPDSVTGIGDRAFFRCTSLPSISLPAGLTSLGSYAFMGCSNATGVITIPGGVTVLPEGCFAHCSSFYKLEFGPQVTEIGNNAFLSCSKLTNVYYDGFRAQWQGTTVGSGNDKLQSASFQYLYINSVVPNTRISYVLQGYDGCLYLNGWDELPDGAMPWTPYGPWITELEIYSGITYIGRENFQGCTGLTKVRLPRTLETVSLRAFQQCGALTDVYYDGLESEWEEITIESGNEPLLYATLHTGTVGGLVPGTNIYWSLNDEGTLTLYFDMDMGVTDMPDFQDDREQPWYEYQDQIRKIVVSEGVTSLGSDNFSCTNVEEVVLPSSVTSIDTSFAYCTCLEEFTFPDTVETLDGGVFFGCGNLYKVRLPAGLTAIPNSLFSGCGVLGKVYMPSTVTSIGNYAFPSDGDFAAGGDLYFDGTSAQWAAITKGTGNESLNGCVMHFNPPELAIDETNFPDPNFRGYVATNLDTDHSGWLTDEERLAVTEIRCGAVEIESLQGIQYFPELTYLDCTDNNLHGELDLTQNLKLQTLLCGENSGLDDLDVTGLTELFTLSCPNCVNLSNPDLSTNISLHVLDCSGCQLSALDLSANRELTVLRCFDNYLSELDLSAQTELRQLYCSSNELETLDVSACTLLYALDCSGNGLQTLTLGELPALKELYCNANALVSLDLIGCPLVLSCVTDESASYTETPGYCEYRLGEYVLRADKSLLFITDRDGIPVDEAHFPDPAFRAYVAEHCDTNKNGYLKSDEIAAVKQIDVRNMGIASLQGIQYFGELEHLRCEKNSITELDLSLNPKIYYLNASQNPLTELDLSANTALSTLDVYLCPNLSSLNLSGLTELSYLMAYDDALTELDLSSNTALEELYVYNNQLTALDLTANTQLSYLEADGMDSLVSLNLSGLTKLAYVDVNDCELTSLDLSDCALTYLECDHNPLETLILGQQEALESLYCYAVELQELDISGCPILVDAWLNGTHTEYSWGLEVNGSEGLGGYMELDKDQTVVAESGPDHTPGDINGDGRINVADVTLLAKYVKAHGVGVEAVTAALDVNGDGRINVADVTLLAKYVKAHGVGVVIY